MSNTLSVKISNRKSATAEWYEGTVSITGLKPTKLTRRVDGSTQFPTKSALSAQARNVAKALGYTDAELVDNKPVAQKKIAAKKSPVKTKTSSPSSKKKVAVQSKPATN